mgnify:CR=1 FL=1
MTRIGGRSQLRAILLPNEAAAEGQQGIACQKRACKHGRRSRVITAHRAEAAHHFSLLGALVTKMLSVWRRRGTSEHAG